MIWLFLIIVQIFTHVFVTRSITTLWEKAVLRIRIHLTVSKVTDPKIQIRRIYMFSGLSDLDPLFRDRDPDKALDPSIIKQK